MRFGDLPTDQAWHVQNLINSSADPGHDRRRGRPPGVQREAPARLHRHAAPARRGLGGTLGRGRQAARRGLSQRRVLSATARAQRQSSPDATRRSALASHAMLLDQMRAWRSAVRHDYPSAPLVRSSAIVPATAQGRRRAPDRYPRPMPARGLSCGRSWRARAIPAARRHRACPRIRGRARCGLFDQIRASAPGRPRECRRSAAIRRQQTPTGRAAQAVSAASIARSASHALAEIERGQARQTRHERAQRAPFRVACARRC